MKSFFKILTLLFSLCTLILSNLCIHQWQFPYDENGVYFDTNNAVIFRREAIFVYGVLAVLSLIVTLVLFKCLKVTPSVFRKK
jgi:hypothetical protein